ncbi:hypothetical protein THAOC_06796 [Thalassiosira oceanica]|uniref:Uncharacterized protein n=1 Tax=Thalassiosira oceanica TaxID=159749 RepID=K0TLC4_THAOC|nr:hypothetical protein THAOC_06796 [Thalassiosira oceanica]|eukprot:EJK71737.1 hypothetical protein THAOC_06796 [Thalassiosira oceanica]
MKCLMTVGCLDESHTPWTSSNLHVYPPLSTSIIMLSAPSQEGYTSVTLVTFSHMMCIPIAYRVDSIPYRIADIIRSLSRGRPIHSAASPECVRSDSFDRSQEERGYVMSDVAPLRWNEAFVLVRLAVLNPRRERLGRAARAEHERRVVARVGELHGHVRRRAARVERNDDGTVVLVVAGVLDCGPDEFAVGEIRAACPP